ncbi:MAG: sigma 54-interacting transcriptional regulator [Firmicutes bacterium]|nr:sigma 54-interacting transcriptional regulator [Bacillota bacterium]
MRNESLRQSMCFLTFSRDYASRVKSSLMECGYNDVRVEVTDEENTKALCTGLMKKGIKAFIYENNDIEKSEGAIFVPVVCRTADYLQVYMSREETDNIVIFSDEPEIIDKKILEHYWRIEPVVVDAAIPAEKRKALYKDIAEAKAVCIGPGRLGFEAGLNKVRFKRVYPSKETIMDTIETVEAIYGAKFEEMEKNKENILRMEQYKVVFNFTNDAILATDENGVIIAANDMVYKFLRWNKEDRLEGKRIDAVIPGTKMIKAMDKPTGDIGDVFELPHCTVLTHRIPIEIDGKRRGVVSTFQDLAALQEHEKNARVNYMKNKKGFAAKYNFDDIKGSSNVIKEVKNIAKSYASSSSTVLILGETGTGKELFAQSIHNASNCADGPFVAVNCAAIPKNLLEAEFFGYEEGSFTGASKGGKAGVFEMAHKGTIFLDEIGEMPLEMQVQLLRVIQEKEVRRIGSSKVIPVEVRVIAATNRDLQSEVRKGNFREDLYYRLNVLELKIPPLRKRKEDIREIAEEFLKNFDYKRYKSNEALWSEIIEELENYEMKGNVRELQNMLERLNVMMTSKHINTSALFMEINKGMNLNVKNETYYQKNASKLQYEDEEEFASKDESGRWERQRIIKALKNNGLSRTKAAAELGISRSTLWNKMKYYKIDL